MATVRVYFDRNNNIAGYAVGDISYPSVEAIQDDATFDITKLQGYKLEDVEGQKHLVFDEEQYNKYINDQKKEEAIKEGNALADKLIEQAVLSNASDADAFTMRYLYPEYEVGISYKKDDRFIYNDKFYKVLQDHTSAEEWKPEEASSLYVEISDPNVEYPDFKQPSGAHDAYSKGDKVMFEGKKYISLIDANTWSPTDYPAEWKLVEE